jgi:type VI secretion system protein ImpD
MSVEQASTMQSPAPAARHAVGAGLDSVNGQPSNLLDSVLSVTPTAGPADSPLQHFVRERSPERALLLWAAIGGFDPAPLSRRDWQGVLNRDIAVLDAIISDQVNAIIHHPRFQQLEASWTGLHYLVGQTDPDEKVIIRVLNLSWKELTADAERALEFDQSQLFRKVYNEEFDTPGGTPYGLLIGDYQVRHMPDAEHPTDDLGALASVAQVAAAAFAPFIASADPALFGIDDFADLDRPVSLARVFEQAEYVKWNALRQAEDSRFVGLALPRILMRAPYADDPVRTDGFRFAEDVDGPDRRRYLWGNAAYAFGAVVVRAFMESGWLAEIRGVKRGEDGGGLVLGLPTCSFGTDKAGIALKASTDLIVSEDLDKELGELGFIPLCHCKDTPYSAFYGNQSVQRPKTYDQAAVTMNAKISGMLQYVLCASRIAHYLKVLAREKIGSFAEAHELEEYLRRWVNDYVAPDAEASAEVKARFPLREAQVRVRERPGAPGNYMCEMHLLPHYQLDALTATVRLRTELAPARPS